MATHCKWLVLILFFSSCQNSLWSCLVFLPPRATKPLLWPQPFDLFDPCVTVMRLCVPPGTLLDPSVRIRVCDAAPSL